MTRAFGDDDRAEGGKLQRSALVIVSGDDHHHDLFGASSAFTLLAAEAGLAARPAVGFKRFTNPLPGTASADVYLLYSDGGEFPIAQQQALVDLVRGGKGLLVVHSGARLSPTTQSTGGLPMPLHALLGYKQVDERSEIVVGCPLTIEISAKHCVTRGLARFEVRDGTWATAIDDVDHQVLAYARTPAGPVPAMYVREPGDGRVCYIGAGHDRRSWGDPAFRSLTIQALRWAARLTGSGDGG